MHLQQCQQCGRKFKYHHQLRRHRKVHSMMNRTTYRCKICNKSFTFLHNLRQHLAQHFNYKSGENLYIDDLAIGVTIEPVDEPNCGWVSTPRGSKTGLGPTRESPEGEPCHCVPSANYSVNCGGSFYSCAECPRHYASTSSFLPCSAQCIGQASACSSTHHVNPHLVLHVDTTHDSVRIPAARSDCAIQQKGNVDFTSMGVLNSQYKQCSRRCVPIRSATVTRYNETTFSDQCTYSADSDPAEDSDNNVFLEPHDQIPVISSQTTRNSLNRSEPNQMMESGNDKIEEVGRSHGQYEYRILKEKKSRKQCGEGMEDFDDDATFNDLSTMFPDLNENQNDYHSEADPNSDNIMETEINNDDLVLGFVKKDESRADSVNVNSALAGLENSVSDDGSKGNELLDIEVCVKNGLDSKAINPTVVVSDLQNDMNIMSMACMQKDENKITQFACDICNTVFENKSSLSNHMKSQDHMLKGAKKTVPARRRSERKMRKPNLEKLEEVSVSQKKDTKLKIRKTIQQAQFGSPEPKPSESKLVSVLPEDLMAMMARPGKKNKRSHGPQLKATVKKLDIHCYLCRRQFTTKQHFIVHAKDHLKKLGYNPSDLFYCTICYAFYPCENDLREHLIGEHMNDDVSAVDKEDQLDSSSSTSSRQPAVLQGKTFSHGGVIENPQEQQVGGAANYSRDLENDSDSDMAESTTDQLVFPTDQEPDPFGFFSQESRTLDSSCPAEVCMCHICGETLGSLSQLNMHIKVHDEVPLKSTILPDPSETRSNISQTQAQTAASAASDIKSVPRQISEGFNCRICGRLFKQLGDVEKHMVVHDPKRQKLKCPLCRGECMWKSNFRTHLLRHATPIGQVFNSVKFNPNSKILCPFCGEVNTFYDVNEFKEHMMVHVNKILNEECAKAGNAVIKSKKNMHKVEMIRDGPFNHPSSGPNPVTEEFENKTTKVKTLAVRKMPANSTCPVQIDDSFHAQYHSRPSVMKNPVQKLFNTTAPTKLSSGMTSTPNPYSGFPDKAISVSSLDTSPGGSVKGNSGLFMSPEWAWSSRSQNSSSGVKKYLTKPSGFYTNISSYKGSKQGMPSDGICHEQIANFRPELNDSGFIQTFSGESDTGETMTPQSVPLFSHAPVSVHGDGHARPPFCSMNNVDQNDTMAKGEFLSYAKVVELMQSTTRYTETFKTEGYLCSICGECHLNQGNVKQHLLKHFDDKGKFAFVKKEGKHECPICMKSIHDRRSATAHLFSHWGISIIKCPVCDRPFNFTKTMKMHVRRHHPDFEFATDCHRKM